MTAIAVVGPGAIGGVVAGVLLGRGDHDVTICGRTSFTELTFDHDGRTDVHPVTVYTGATALGPVPLVILTTKTFQTEAAAPFLEALCDERTTLLIAQNGVEHLERLRPLVPRATLVPAVVYLPASRTRPGHASLDGRAVFAVPSGPDAAVVEEAFAGTGLRIRVHDDWKSQAWTKLLSNCAGGAITTLARTSNRVLADPDARQLALALMEEVVAVGRAEGAELPDGIGDIVLDGVAAAAGDHWSSIVVDRVAGRPTEWQERNEVVVRMADRHGIDVPLNRALTTLLRLGEP